MPVRDLTITLEDATAQELIDLAKSEGITLESDEYGPRLKTRLSSRLYIAVMNYRKATYLRIKKGALDVSED